MTPLGPAAVDAAAVDWLASTHCIPINEAPHATEHSIENQLPFLVHAASWGWDLHAAGCCTAADGAADNAAAVHAESSGHDRQQQQQRVPASLSIVPISVGYLGHQQGLIQQYGAAVADLLYHLRARNHQHHLHQQQSERQQDTAGPATAAGCDSAAADRHDHEVVLVVTSDFTHAGPWYRELPPAGVALADYMTAQDSPLLQVRLRGPAGPAT
jgi:predicted class III extradiol MEMO1 family dioxygenase